MQTTKEYILHQLKLNGDVSADDLAEGIGLTAMAIRQHMYQLQDDGAVECVSTPAGRGRPKKRWELTEKADVYFPDAHRDLSVDLINSIKETLGAKSLDALIKHRTDKQKEKYSKVMANANSLEEQLHLLAKERTAEGYMASVSQQEGDFYFTESHCPICEAAKSCTGLCSEELRIFQELTKGQASVERTEYLLNGGRRCAYKISQKKSTEGRT